MFQNRYRSLVLALLLASVAAGCEETVDITDAVYRERLVVYGVVEPGKEVAVTFTRTLPINEPYSEEAAALSDVEASITVETPVGASERFTLTHVGRGRYVAAGLVGQSLHRYTLNATWRGRTVSGRTIVPSAPDVDSVRFVSVVRDFGGEAPDTMLTVGAHVRPEQGFTYLLTSADLHPQTGQPIIHDTYGGAQLYRERDTNERGWLDLVDNWGYYLRQQTMAAVVVTYDEQYYEFQRTYYNSGDQGPFGTGSDTVWWTVEGDGLGLFIGRRLDIFQVQ